MIKIFTLFLAVGLTTASIAQVTVPEVTKALYNKKTASWCAPCYEWGIGVDDDIELAVSGRAVSFKLTASATGSLYNSACSDMYNAYDNQSHNGWPNFFVNAFNETEYPGGGGISPSITVTNCSGAVNSFFSPTTADINAGFEVTYAADFIDVDVTTEFFNAMNGNYYTGVYLIEDQVTYQQNSDGGYVSVTMDKILRGSLAGSSSFGVSVGTGAVSAGTTVDGSYSIAVDPAWDGNNLRIITVVWEDLGGGSYTVINANDAPSAETGVGIDENISERITVYPNPANDVVFVDFKSNDNIQGVNLYNALGQEVQISNTPITNGITSFDISSLDNGIYYVHALYADKKVVEKIIKY